MAPVFPLSPERGFSGPKRSASLNRSSWSWSLEAPTACEPKPARRSSAQSLTRNLSQIALAQTQSPRPAPPGEHMAGLQSRPTREIRGRRVQSASTLPRKAVAMKGQNEDLSARPSKPSFDPPTRRISEASTCASDSKGPESGTAREKGPSETTANTAARVAALLSKPAGVVSGEVIEDSFLSARRQRRETPGWPAKDPRPSPEGRAGVASHCWRQERKPSEWQGPPPPERAPNRTLHRGSKAIPFGRLSLRQETPSSSEYGKAYTRRDREVAGVPSPHARALSCENTFGRGSQAFPRGLCLDGTSRDYGSCYRRVCEAS
ncbi:unnamed protein product [Effrenium voratum]|nr:unnamed protein product [Effrenium voratum]